MTLVVPKIETELGFSPCKLRVLVTTVFTNYFEYAKQRHFEMGN